MSGKIRLSFLIVFIFLEFTLLVFPQDNLVKLELIFNKANILYEEKKYSEAVKLYESILKKGYESGYLFYNLGNAYFKKGELGKAILNYERALKLIPLDSDLRTNYNYALSLIKVSVKGLESFWFIRFLNKVFSPFTIDTLTILLSFIYFSLLGVLTLSFYLTFFRKYRRVIALSLIFLFFFSFSGLILKVSKQGKEAIVIVKEAQVKFAPLDEATLYFRVYEGQKLRIISQEGTYYKIRDHRQKIGWIEKKALEVI
ncbi:MAG TPA: tetratricopeptide repeat protein [Candidatus Omnitrophica bacterium]|nr:tetratricopeptide repeat protein [Candidatus Omnitrophota bacterium]